MAESLMNGKATVADAKLLELQSRIVGLSVINDALSLQLRDVNALVASIVQRLKPTEVNIKESKDQNDK
jgi:hypothetical protein